MSGLLTGMGPQGAALALLVLGHVLADFVFQGRWIIERKHRASIVGLHAGIVLLVHVLTYLPLVTLEAIGVLAGVAVTHLVIDLAKSWVKQRAGGSLTLFVVDQALHGLVLLVAWTVLADMLPTEPLLLEGLALTTETPVTAVTTGGIVLSAFAFNHHGGNALVRAVLPEDPTEPDEDELAAGRLIGTLERFLVLVLALASQWSAIALVIAAKSIARFEELKERSFAEYYLVGTLTSVLVAVISGVTVLALV